MTTALAATLLAAGICISVVAGGVPYGGSVHTAGMTYPTHCPASQVECMLISVECVDYDVSGWCTTLCGVPCGAACLSLGAWYYSLPCSVGCGAICFEACKYCEEWEENWYCYCPGDLLPTAVAAPVRL
ncbi:hypothetical protein JW848_03715 [Candidatus Bipolaricaulota bacterium]|nr:hypothetical protein [Candidatus Bipolaricaulota bacterium]